MPGHLPTCPSVMSKSLACRLRVRALAKINLSLRVLGTRSDGFHELRTTFQSLALHDTLTLTAVAGAMTITCDAPDCPVDESNLVWRAAERLWRADGRRGRVSGVHVDILKRIPMQAGLGGGSSDAAAALRGLTALWGARVSDEDLSAIARSLGADVAFFLEGGTALGVDRGDVMYPLINRPRSTVVLVIPGFGVSTKDAFGWWDADGIRSPVVASEWANDLQPPVAARHPEVERIVKRLRRCGATYAAMSGSGSAIFGLFDRDARARQAAAALTARTRHVLLTHTVSREHYRRLSHPRQSVGRVWPAPSPPSPPMS
jgi:4-diphosphocytidyl-2-C-methyl-D-erythritol kinase